MKNSNKELEIILDYNFKNSHLLRQSLIHKSFDSSNNNEKLEFLGDRVLGLVISKKLIEIYPEEKEGIIDKKFANLVNKKICSNISKKLNIKKFMFLCIVLLYIYFCNSHLHVWFWYVENFVGEIRFL